jgi:hypothetical protein
MVVSLILYCTHVEATTHGDPQQFMAALQFFNGKSRQ